ncbi:histone H1 DNA binding protein [Cenarchaeum symbiosum A]|uniref:Histone H1 DNA binding protein n=1 Tax=Cenarchaeum symbiosum (strain A) TaxID=414004 RepID=A0RWR5_CENSY|nr:histone H1 DNA binding protein [Cenarchaeum symbiosum A]
MHESEVGRGDMSENFVTFCVACARGVTKDEMKYVDGRIFHKECYARHGGQIRFPNPEIGQRVTELKVDLIQLRKQLAEMNKATDTKKDKQREAGKKAAKTRKLKNAGKKAAKTRKLKNAGKKAAKTRKLKNAGKKAAKTRKRREAARKAAKTRARNNAAGKKPARKSPSRKSTITRRKAAGKKAVVRKKTAGKKPARKSPGKKRAVTRRKAARGAGTKRR